MVMPSMKNAGARDNGVSSGEELWVYGVLFQQMDTSGACSGWLAVVGLLFIQSGR